MQKSGLLKLMQKSNGACHFQHSNYLQGRWDPHITYEKMGTPEG